MTFAFWLVDGLPERWSLSTNVRSTHCIIAKSLLNLPDCFHFGIFKLLVKLDAVPMLHAFSEMQCDEHILQHLTH
jgi:hypothetical protein